MKQANIQKQPTNQINSSNNMNGQYIYIGSITQSFLAGEKKNPSMVPFSFFLMLFNLLGKLSNGWNFPKPNSYSILARLMGYFRSMAYLKPRFRDFLLESEVSSISKLVLISLWNLQTRKKWHRFKQRNAACFPGFFPWAIY